jgi:glutaredoxin 3
MSAEITMYSTRYCPFCMGARSLFEGRKLSYKDIGVDGKPELRRRMTALSGRHTVPQIWVGDQHIGGFDELRALDQQGQLDKLLKAA